MHPQPWLTIAGATWYSLVGDEWDVIAGRPFLPASVFARLPGVEQNGKHYRCRSAAFLALSEALIAD